ncbi:alpha/beta hydrolase [Arthrobacter sp. Soil763]|uniref:alpha/beta hydrolase n=1 Tax=Arthrobacter sp. Soil763 TaxID=1736402 RepID=UPI0006FA4337|nr:alpha/beta hydrolase-fold protein [Arthrobacter sp. Soil763]KRE80041.1 esterase [Arthrobacter sp. Soil763]
MGFAEDLRIVDGPVLWAAWAAGAAGAFYLLLPPGGWRRRRTPAALLAACLPALAAVLLAAAVVLAAHWLLVYALYAFPDVLPPEVLAWSVAGVAALLLALFRIRSARRRPLPSRRWVPAAASAAAVAGLLGLSAVQINAYFGLNHTLGDLAGTAVARVQPLEQELQRRPEERPVGLDGWTPPPGLPAAGLVRKAAIPGTASGFRSREAYVYLPPAYQASPRPALPVLVLVSGQPGGPSDWLTGGALRSRMDAFARAHHGVAPVVVVVDPNGAPEANTLCMDSRIARADTFLATDVPAWIRGTLDVDPNPRQWAAGGFSFGATCAVQLATRHPDIYSAALAFSSEEEPALAKERHRTIEAAFGGDTAAFERQIPLRLLQERRYDGAAYFAAGERDTQFVRYLDVLSAAAQRAGFSVRRQLVPDVGHSWEVAARGLPSGLDFLASRWGIAP